MTDATDEEPGSLSGDIVPSEPGKWLTYPAAAALWKIKPKAVYRRIRRGKMLGRKNPETGDPEIWVPRAEEPGSLTEEREPHSLAVPDQQERFLELLNRATADLGRQVQQLTEEREQERIRNKILTAERDDLAARLRASDAGRQGWWPWKWWKGS